MSDRREITEMEQSGCAHCRKLPDPFSTPATSRTSDNTISRRTPMTTNETVTILRTAATQMRRRAQAATGHYWNSDNGETVYTVDTEPAAVTTLLTGEFANVVHSAGWGPATAITVADWLDLEASMAERRDNSTEGQTFHALAVARAYLDAGWDGADS